MKKAAQWEAPQFVLIPKYHLEDQIKDNEVGGACGTHGRGEKSVQGFGGKARGKETIRMTEAQMLEWDQNGSY
jgi:hypothetical protein